MMVAPLLMHPPHILRINRLVDAISKIVPRRELDPRHHLQPGEDRLGRHCPAGDEIVAMLPITSAEDGIRRGRAPKAEIVQRLKPCFDVLNIFKTYHEPSLPNPRPASQICGGII